jgi:hypothetical protein
MMLVDVWKAARAHDSIMIIYNRWPCVLASSCGVVLWLCDEIASTQRDFPAAFPLRDLSKQGNN